MLTLFFAQGVSGCLAAFLLIPMRAAGRSFFRYAAGQTAVFSIFALALAISQGWPLEDRALPLALTSLLLVSAAGTLHMGRLAAGKALLALALPVSLAGILREAASFAAAPAGAGGSTLLYAADAITSGLTTGGALVAMMLGHAYLNIPGLPVRHLERLCLGLLAALGARAAVFALSMALHGETVTPLVRMLFDLTGGAVPVEGLDPFVLVGVLVHGLCGIVVPAAFAVMAWRSAAVGGTQSATGILYVTLVVILMGELASRYLLTFTGLPL